MNEEEEEEEEGGGCRLSRKGSFGEGVKGSENLVWNFVRKEEGGKLSMLFWVGVSCEIMWVAAR